MRGRGIASSRRAVEDANVETIVIHEIARGEARIIRFWLRMIAEDALPSFALIGPERNARAQNLQEREAWSADGFDNHPPAVGDIG